MRNTRSSLVGSLIVLVVIVLISLGVAVLIPWITHRAELDTPRGAAQVEVALQATATATPMPTDTPIPTVTPTPTSTASATTTTSAETAGAVQAVGTAIPATNTQPGQSTSPVATAQTQESEAPAPPATQSIEVVVTVKDETEEEEEAAVVASPAWETALSGRQAVLELVIVNQGEIPITPCFVIPAVYDEYGIPLDLPAAGFTPNVVSFADSSAFTQEPVGDICGTGIAGEPVVYYFVETEKILPASALAFTLTLQLPTDAPLPYKGQVDVYIPEAPPPKEDEEKSKAEPYQSLEFTVRERSEEDFATAWKNLRDWGEPVLKAFLEFAAVILAVILLVALYNQVRNYLKPSVSLGTLTTESEDKTGTGEKIKALLQDELDRFRGSRPYYSFSPTLATATAQTELFTLPTKLKEFGAVQVVLDILEQLFKRNVITVTGQTQQSKARGAGLTLTITDNRTGSIVDTQTFWELDYSGTGQLVAESGASIFDPYLLIVQPAATWITYKVSEHLGKPYAPLGTGSWQSHANCVCALHMFDLVGRKNAPSDAKHRALDLFYTALEGDPDNPVANINLARFIFEAAGQQKTAQAKRLQYELVQARLKDVAASMERRIGQEETEVISDHELWLYQSLYGQAVVASVEALVLEGKELNLPERARAKRNEVLENLLELREKLVKKAEELPKKPDQQGPGRSQAAVPSQELVPSQGQDTGHTQQPKTPEELLEELEGYIVDFAKLAELENKLADEHFAVQVRALRQASLCLLGMTALDQGGEPWLASIDPPREDFAVVIAGAGRNMARINYRVHYSLACYYSLAMNYKKLAADKKAWCIEKGFFHLALGLELPGDLSNYAKVDGDLENLRRKDPDRFNAIVNRHAETPVSILADPGSLDAVLDILSKQADVDTPQELLRAGRTRANRRSLATKSDGKLPYKVITQWVRIADLMRLAGVDELYARLLYEAGVVSPQVLKGKKAVALHKALEEFNKKNKLVKRLPLKDQLSKWIKAAKGLEDLVE